MSIDKLQARIRKLKNPSVVDLGVTAAHIPPHLLEEEGDFVKAYGRFCRELLDGLKDAVPAVRFSFSTFALLGPEGLAMLPELLGYAQALGCYVLLDGVECFSAAAAQAAADTLASWPFDGLVVSAYIGSDSLKPYIQLLQNNEKSLFVIVRTGNKSAPELQDLMTGSRLVYMAAADMVNRLGESLVGRCGYSQVAGVGTASSADCLRSLRSKHKNLFLLLEGYDYANANAKNCSYAFDKLGHGAAACAGYSITGAWEEAETDSTAYVQQAIQAAERMKKNLLRYITVL